MTAEGFRVDRWTPPDINNPAVVQDPNGGQWWIYFPKGTFRHNPDAEHRWGPYPTEGKAAETLVGFRYQRQIEETSAELNRNIEKRDATIRLLFVAVLLACSIALVLLWLILHQPT